MSTKSKGALWERIAERVMQHVFKLVVHTTERKMLPMKWGGWMSLSNDIFGCIDHVGVGLEQKVWFVQTTTDSAIGRKAKEIRQIPWNTRYCHVEIWRGVGGKKGRKWDRRAKPGEIEVDKWYFQRYRIENDFKMVKGDTIDIPQEILDAVFSKKKTPKCACGKAMKKSLEQKVGKCAACIRLGDQVKKPTAKEAFDKTVGQLPEGQLPGAGA